MSDEQRWAYDDAVKARVGAELAKIDAAQAGYPRCALCGQRSLKLDRFELCSKVTDAHKDWRARVRADEKAGAR